jgi:hypothetical protein
MIRHGKPNHFLYSTVGLWGFFQAGSMLGMFESPL